MAVQDYKINYKSDFVLTINGDAGWAIPFCIKFWTGMPSQAYFVGFDGVKYVNCRVGDTPTQLLVMFDDHHLPIGKLMMQIAYHTTIEEFPGSVFDEVTNARDVIVTIDGTDYQVMLDFTGEDAPELEFDLPAYANEAERIQNELQRQQNEADRIAAELQREQATAAAVQGAENVNAQLNGTTLTVTNRNGVSTSVNTKGEQGAQGPVGPEGQQGEQGPKGEKGDTGATGPQGIQGPAGPQGQTGVSITDFVKTGETETDTLYDIEFSDDTTKPVAIPKGEKGDQGEQGPEGPQGPMGDVAVITPEQQAAFTMYSETGQNTNGPMTQKAVTDAVLNEVANLLTQANKTKSNGTIDTANNKWKTNSDYYGYWYKIDAFRGKKLTINTSVNGINTIAFTTVIETANNSPMDYAAGNIMEIIPSNTTRTYIIPSDANYIFVLTYGNGTDRTPQSLKIFESTQDTLDSLGGLKKDITSEINISAGGFYRSSDGAWIESADWSSSDLIPTDDIESLYVSSAVNANMLQVAFFDVAGKIMLSSSVVGNGVSSVASPNIVKVPSGVKYAVVSGKTSESIPISVSAVYNKPSYVVDIEDIIEILAKDDVTVPANNHGFYRTSDNAWISTDRWSSTNLICTDGYDYVRNTSVINNAAYSIAFLDGKGKVIGGIAGSASTLDSMETIEADIPPNAKYVVMTGFTANGDSVTSELLKRNGSDKDNPIADMKKITLVIIYGQSLSVGADSVPISTTPEYNNLLMLNTGLISRPQTSAITAFVPMVENSWETPASGTGEMFVEALQKENAFGSYKSEWNGHDLVFACPGVGSASIDALTTTYYQSVENILTAVKNICNARGYSLDIPAWCWVQGEQDTKTSMSATDYKTKLLALQNKFCNSVSTITGITERPKCIIYQPSCQNLFDPTAQYNYAYDHMGVPTAFMELLRDNSEFIASSPTYIFDPSNSGGVWVHLNEQSYKLLGAYQGYALKRLMIDGERNQGVVPLNITVDGNTIQIKYNVPCPPLRFDTDYVNAAPNMGFNVIKSDNTELISSVSVFNDTVTIVCTSSPSGAKLRYGMNGTYHEFISGQYHYYSGAGRVIGARGNLRDDQGCYVYKNIQGYKYPMYNWAYTFEKILD